MAPGTGGRRRARDLSTTGGRGATPITTLKDYAAAWLASRALTPRTRLLYRGLLDALVLPDLGDARLDRVSPTTVRNW